MVRVAAAQLARQGLDRTSFSTVLETSDAPRGSIYHHFPGGKSELVADAVLAAGSRGADGLRALTGAPADVVVREFMAAWRSLLDASHCEAGCAVAAVAVVQPEEAAMSEAVRHVFDEWLALLETALRAGGVPASSSGVLAASVLAAVEGALVVVRGTQRIELFDDVAAAMVELVASSMH
jgi:AcrR family transcriptional regulator